MKALSKRGTGYAQGSSSEMKAIARDLEIRGVDVVKLQQGEPDFPTPPHIVAAAEEALHKGYTKYVPAEGYQELREAVRDKLEVENSIPNVQLDELVITNGAKLGLFLAVMALIDDGDEVLGVGPFFGPYTDLVRNAGGVFRTVDLTPDGEGSRLDRDRFRNAISKRTKILLINTPQNPNGKVWTRDELECVADVAAEKDCYILVDEVYERIIYDGRVHHSIASFSADARERTVLVNSLSKTYAMTGWRLGYTLAPKALSRVMVSLHHDSGRCASAFVQRAGIAALRGPQESVARMVEEYEARRQLVDREVSTLPGWSLGTIEGAFYAFPRVEVESPSTTPLCVALLRDAHVMVSAGESFGDPRCLRISFASSRERILEGLGRIRSYTAAWGG